MVSVRAFGVTKDAKICSCSVGVVSQLTDHRVKHNTSGVSLVSFDWEVWSTRGDSSQGQVFISIGNKWFTLKW